MGSNRRLAKQCFLLIVRAKATFQSPIGPTKVKENIGKGKEQQKCMQDIFLEEKNNRKAAAHPNLEVQVQVLLKQWHCIWTVDVGIVCTSRNNLIVLQGVLSFSL